MQRPWRWEHAWHAQESIRGQCGSEGVRIEEGVSSEMQWDTSSDKDILEGTRWYPSAHAPWTDC